MIHPIDLPYHHTVQSVFQQNDSFTHVFFLSHGGRRRASGASSSRTSAIGGALRVPRIGNPSLLSDLPLNAVDFALQILVKHEIQH